jgi:hypothetical protein
MPLGWGHQFPSTHEVVVVGDNRGVAPAAHCDIAADQLLPTSRSERPATSGRDVSRRPWLGAGAISSCRLHLSRRSSPGAQGAVSRTLQSRRVRVGACLGHGRVRPRERLCTRWSASPGQVRAGWHVVGPGRATIRPPVLDAATGRLCTLGAGLIRSISRYPMTHRPAACLRDRLHQFGWQEGGGRASAMSARRVGEERPVRRALAIEVRLACLARWASRLLTSCSPALVWHSKSLGTQCVNCTELERKAPIDARDPRCCCYRVVANTAPRIVPRAPRRPPRPLSSIADIALAQDDPGVDSLHGAARPDEPRVGACAALWG